MQCRQVHIDCVTAGSMIAFHLHCQSIASDGSDPRGRHTGVPGEGQHSLFLGWLYGQHNPRLTFPEQQCIASKSIER
jgi:hypothetical protein